VNREDVLRQVWPTFLGEARELVQALGARVLALEAGESSPELHEAVQRDAHSLKGMAGSLGLSDLVALAHAIEDVLVAARTGPALSHARADAILRTLDAIDAALERCPGPGDVTVPELPDRLAALRGSPPPAASAPAPAPASAGARPEVTASPARPPAPPEERASGSPPEQRPGAREDRTIRVAAGTVEQIGAFVESFALAHAAAERRAQAVAGAGEELQAIGLAIRAALGHDPQGAAAALDRLLEIARTLARHGAEAQRDALRHQLEAASAREDLRDLRLVPVSLALAPLRRAVRDAAGRLGKDVDLHLEGEDLRLDRRVVEAVKDPLVHLVRNAVDHGIEAADVRAAAGKARAGSVRIRVAPRGHRLSIQVADDGAGLSAERIRRRAVERGLLGAEHAARLPDADVLRLAFTPGFSTAERVTDVSGRGVGLDVVQNAVSRLQGSIDVSSTPGRGATFELDLPLTLSASLAVLVRVENERSAIPAEAVERVLRLPPREIGEVLDRRVVPVGGAQVPFEELGEILRPGGRAAGHDGLPRPALLLRLGGSRLALGVDEVLGEREIVVRGLGRRGARAALLAGAALLDDGAIVSVLNPAMLLGHHRAAPAPRGATATARIVVADDSLTTRTAVKTILEIAGYTVVPACDGEDAWSRLARGDVDLVVSDVQMPRLDGLGLARRIKADPERRRIPVVLVTSLDSAEDRRAGLEAGADGYVVKQEVESGALLALVRALLPGSA
jgi:two-component system chemotaxis sensor kinase CheA